MVLNNPTRPQPPTPNRENELYESYKTASESEKPAVLQQLFRVMTTHACRVAYTIFRYNRDDLAEEIAQDALLDIDDFRGDSLFSTWFHARIKYACYNERRTLRIKKEWRSKSSDDSWLTIPTKRSVEEIEARLAFDELLKTWTETEQNVVKAILDGHTVRETAEMLGLSSSMVSRIWQNILDRVRNDSGEVGQ